MVNIGEVFFKINKNINVIYDMICVNGNHIRSKKKIKINMYIL